MRKEFGKLMIEMAEQDDKLVVLIGDISHHLLSEFQQRFPQRFYNLGICEQSLVGVAAGLAAQGMRPIVHTIAPFCAERAFEQIKIDLCYQNLDVTIISVGSSFDYADLGCTHHCYEDVSILRSLPNIQVYVPNSSSDFNSLLKKSWANGRPKYFKLSEKEDRTNVFNSTPGEYSTIVEGKQDLILVAGHLSDECSQVAKELGMTLLLFSDLTTLEQSQRISLIEVIRKSNNIFTVEENSIVGGLGDYIADFISSTPSLNKGVRKIGIPKLFLEKYGTAAQHRAALGLTTEGIKDIIRYVQSFNS